MSLDNRFRRSLVSSSFVAVTVGALAFAACGGSSSPAGTGGAGNADGGAGKGGVTGTGGASGTGGAATGAGGV